jgi:serine/threonine protein kinase
MGEWPNGLILDSRAELRPWADAADNTDLVPPPSPALQGAHPSNEAADDVTEVEQVVFRLDAGLSLTQIAAIPGLEREVIAVSLPRAEHHVGSSPGSAGGLPERMLDRYRVLSEIGHGAMGVVYHAFDRTLEREVALKVLPSHRVSDPEWRDRFLQEARSAASLACRHICAIHDFGEADGVPYISMELIRGERLLDILRRSRLPRGRYRPSSCRSSLSPRRALALATEIAQALAQAHEHGIVHLDLKPANVMVSEHGHAKLIDFGLARLVEPKESAHGEGEAQSGGKSPGMICGTPSYMSPEQICGLAVDHRSDIFTFGVLLHEMLTGANPFQHGTPAEALEAVLNGSVPPVELPRATDVASGLQRVLDRCLERDPHRRYQSMREVIEDLREVRLGARANASSRSKASLRLRTLFATLSGLARLLVAALPA